MPDADFKIQYEQFQTGYAPLAHLDEHTFMGDKGQATDMKRADIISEPGILKQGPGLSTLTNGADSGVIDELVRFVMDKSINGGESYAIGETKLFKLTPGTVVDDTDFPRTISNCEEGESVINLEGDLFYFYNKSSEGDIGAYENFSTFNDTWGSSTDLALEDAPHPSATKEDIMTFGNGQYLGTFIKGTAMLDTQKLDFGNNTEVADVIYQAGSWYIAVNSGDADDYRTSCQIFMYDGSAMSNLLTDEAGVGVQRIGFLYPLNGVVYVAYEDLTSEGYVLGYLSGRSLEPLRYFTGDLPSHKDKSLYKNTILFTAGSQIYSGGASVQQVENQVSSLAEGQYSTIGGIGAPFGDMLVPSTDGTNNSLDKFSGYTTETTWKSISTRTTKNKKRGNIDELLVFTKPLGKNARCDVRIVADEGQRTSNWREVSGENKTRHTIQSIEGVKNMTDCKLEIKYENGSTSQNCPIRKVIAFGNYV